MTGVLVGPIKITMGAQWPLWTVTPTSHSNCGAGELEAESNRDVVVLAVLICDGLMEGDLRHAVAKYVI